MKNKILIINGHPNSDSFNFALSEAYKKGAAQSGKIVKILNLNELKFDLNQTNFKLENVSTDIKNSQEQIIWADHLVWIYPIWWYTMPALMKIFIEQVFVSGFAFKYLETKNQKIVKWEKYLTGKTAELIATMDAPPFYYKFIVKDPGYKSLKASFSYCGMKITGKTYFGSVKLSSETQKKKWLLEMENKSKK